MKIVTSFLNKIVKDRSHPRYVEATVIACRNFRGRPRPLTLNFFLFTYLFLLGFFLISIAETS